MIDLLRPILELCIVIPGLLLAYFPVKSYLKRPLAKISIWLLPLILSLCICLGLFCWYFHSSTLPALALIALITIILYLKLSGSLSGNPEQSLFLSVRYLLV